MKKKRMLSAVILATILAAGQANGQQPGAAPLYPAPPPLGPQTTVTPPATEEDYIPGVLSDWIQGRNPCCEGAPGRRWPLYTEWYATTGVAVPVARSSSALARDLQTGWSIGAGVRAMFFNEPLTRAWAVDLHIINTNEGGGHSNQGFPLTTFQGGTKTVFGTGGQPLATIQDYNRTMVGLGLGRFWYLWGTADSPGRHWRVGVDAGGRYGSGHIDLNQFSHVTSVCTGCYVGARTDLEWTCKNVVIFVGGRVEWAYIFSNVLQTQNADLQDLSVLLQTGFRY